MDRFSCFFAIPNHSYELLHGCFMPSHPIMPSRVLSTAMWWNLQVSMTPRPSQEVETVASEVWPRTKDRQRSGQQGECLLWRVG